MSLIEANQAVLFVFDKNSTHTAPIRGELEAAASQPALEAVEVQGTIPRLFFRPPLPHCAYSPLNCQEYFLGLHDVAYCAVELEIHLHWRAY